MHDHGVLNSQGQAHIKSGVNSVETPPKPRTGLPTLFQPKQDDSRLSMLHLQRREGPVRLEYDFDCRIADSNGTADRFLVSRFFGIAFASCGDRPGLFQDEMVRPDA